MVDNSFQDFLINSPLYASIEFEDADHLRGLLFAGEAAVDAHCPQCGRDSVFHSENATQHGHSRVHFYLLHGPQALSFACQRNHEHKMFFGVEIWSASVRTVQGGVSATGKGGVRKFGQYPSHADLQKTKLKNLKPIVDQQDLAELNRAMGLASVGVSVGAFVYLRRVFERLIYTAFDRADLDAEKEQFEKLRMDEKIKELGGYIPEFIVQNRKIYNILSKGIHEYTEVECSELYDVVEQSVLMILEQEAERASRDARAKQISEALKGIS